MSSMTVSFKRAILGVVAVAFGAGMALMAAAPAQATTIATSEGAEASPVHYFEKSQKINGYDFNGDGKPDKVEISITKGSSASVVSFTVNGEEAYAFSDWFYGCHAAAISTKNMGTFLFFDATTDNDYKLNQGLYKYANGKFTRVLNFNEFYGGKGGTYIQGEITKVVGNRIYINAFIQSNLMSTVSAVFPYDVTATGLKRAKTSAKAQYVNYRTNVSNGYLTVASKIKGYTSTKCTKKKCTFKKGKKLKITKVYWKGSTVRFKVKTKSGKTAWVKNPKGYNAKTDSGTWFKEVGRAG